MKVAQSCPTLCHPMTIQSMEFSRPEYWSWSSSVSPADLPNTGMEPGSPALQEDSLPTELSGGLNSVEKDKEEKKEYRKRGRRKKFIQNPYFKNIRIHKSVAKSIIEYVYVLICTCVLHTHVHR